MRSPVRIAVLGAVLLLAATVSLAVDPIVTPECQYAHVVDPCEKNLVVFSVDGPVRQHTIPLGEGEAATYQPGGVDFATVPDFEDHHSFVTQIRFLRVINQEYMVPWRTVDLHQAPGLSNFFALNLEAAAPVILDSEVRYPLYVVGILENQPWLIVLDQEALLAETLDLSELVLASVSLCPYGLECTGLAVDVAVNGFLSEAGIQEAFASVLNTTGGVTHQQVLRIDLRTDSTFGVWLDPWNDEGEPFSGSTPLALGLDYETQQPYGVFQTSSLVADLGNGETSCALPGSPTDVAVWGPGSDLEHPFFHFVTSDVSYGPGLLLGYPAGECPDDSEEYLELEVGGLPHAVAVSSRTSLTPWVFTANKEDGISAVHLSISSAGGTGDRVQVLGDSVLDIPLEGCPARLSIRDEELTRCAMFPVGDPRNPKVDCDEDPDDPRCVDPPDDKVSHPVDLGQN